MLVELFTDCNFRCPLCPCPPWQTDRFKQALTPDDAKRIIDESMKYVPRYNLNFASEPLLSPHIPEIVGHIHSQKRLSWMYTNAMMLTEDTAYKIFDAHLDFVRFAVDGLDADCHEFYRHGSDFNTVFKM
jgi:MoaA/NifB/PqqE/SkfB family radical SAM enzyme